MARIALFYSPFRRHARRTTALGGALVQAGHEVVAHVPEAHLGAALAAGLDARLDPRCAEAVVAIGLPHDHADHALAVCTSLAETAVGSFADVSGVLLGDGAELVVADLHAPWAAVAARSLGLPLITSAVTHTLFPPPGAGGHARSERLDDAEQFLARLGSVSGGPRRGSEFAGDRTIMYTAPELTGPLVADPSVRFVGPLSRDHAPIVSQPTGRPLVYVAPELTAPHRSALLEGIVAALATLERELDAIIVISESIAPTSLNWLPGTTSFVRETPSPETLSHASLALVDAGIDSLLDALLAGVPMVCAPATSDQLAGAQRVCELGAGRLLDSIDTDSVRAAILTGLGDPTARPRAFQLGQALRAIDGPGRVADLAADLLGANTR
jgi:UDP:flavonoid glycosyltransferase YjiC (YdhE family)